MQEKLRIKVIDADGKEYSYWTLKGRTVWESLELMGFNTEGSCGGNARCGKCKVRVEGALSQISQVEREHLLPDELKSGYRLACCCTVEGELTVRLDAAQERDHTKNKLLNYRKSDEAQEQTWLRHFFIPGKQKDMPPIYDRIKAALGECQIELSMENLNQLNNIDRPGRPSLELTALILQKDRVRYIDRQIDGVYGLALDIGSTSLFAALLDLESGELISVASHTNMQRIYGHDIISRITYCMENEAGTETLHRILINNINSMIEELSRESGIKAEQLYRVTAVGNPLMLHFILGLNVCSFGSAPFAGIFEGIMECSANKLGLNVSSFASLILLPQLGGFVGADTTACLLSLAPMQDSIYLLIDLGTNGEIVLCKQGQMWTASAAAGPAFEGGAISTGMRAGTGAIDRVVSGQEGMEFHLIGEGPARGICGSGIIDLVAVLLENGYLDERGTFTEKADSLMEGNINDKAIVMVEGKESSNGSALLFSQDDIRQVQLAKAAVRAAVDILMIEAGISAGELDNIYLAGAFGSFLNPSSLIKIGIIPDIEVNRIKNIGNAAAEGAILALLSAERLHESLSIKENVQYIELAQCKEFQEIFLQNMNFDFGER